MITVSWNPEEFHVLSALAGGVKFNAGYERWEKLERIKIGGRGKEPAALEN
jgi:hypothetical protein